MNHKNRSIEEKAHEIFSEIKRKEEEEKRKELKRVLKECVKISAELVEISIKREQQKKQELLSSIINKLERGLNA